VIISHRGKTPRIAPSAYIAPNAVVCGDVTIGEDCRIMFGKQIIAEGGAIANADIEEAVCKRILIILVSPATIEQCRDPQVTPRSTVERMNATILLSDCWTIARTLPCSPSR
jgi:hypothetical protein